MGEVSIIFRAVNYSERLGKHIMRDKQNCIVVNNVKNMDSRSIVVIGDLHDINCCVLITCSVFFNGTC